MKQAIFKLISIVATMYGSLRNLTDCGYVEYCISILRGGRLTAVSKSHGRNITLGRKVHLRGMNYLTIGSNNTIGEYSIITARNVLCQEPQIIIGDNCNIGPYNHITCINSVIIGDGFLSGRWVTITDNSHGETKLEELHIEPWNRMLKSKGPVVIGKNVWIGDKVTILPGVKIGDGVVVGANSVISHDLPSNCVACGNPARVKKMIK